MRSTESGVADTSAELVAGIAGLAAELAARPAPESGAACYDEVEELGRAVDLLEAAIAARVGVATRSGQVAEWGHASAAAWLRTGLGMRHVRAAERAALAEQLPRLPQVAKRLAAGELSSGYAVAIAGGVRRLDAADCGRAEGLLLGFVDEGHSVGQIARFAEKIKDLIAERDETAAEPEDGRRAERQWWAVHRSGAGAFVKGRFGPELLALIQAKLEPLAAPSGPDDTRDHAERLADALQTHLSGGDSRWDPILIIDLKQQSPWQSGPRPATTPRSAPTAGPDHDADYPAAAEPGPAAGSYGRGGPTARSAEPHGPAAEWMPAPPASTWPFDGTPFTARLADGTPIGMERARQILLNAGFSTFVLGADGHPLYLGRRVRCATPAQRRVLLARYATCVVDDCEIPATGCQVDHVDGWENGQGSDIDRLVMCCSFHNRYKWRHPDRVIISRLPDGRYRYQIARPERLRPGARGGRPTDRRSPGRDP
ncbi:MAG TPA: HNH endonuclease signature motif containing protein [Gemmataceae bacterium]|nr:HNH endonuclease signature motif containing protein [Gemmataceae bacterium]